MQIMLGSAEFEYWFYTSCDIFLQEAKNITVVTVTGDLMNSSLAGGRKPHSWNCTPAFSPS